MIEKVQEATGESVEVAFVDQGYAGDQPVADAEKHGIRLEVVKLPSQAWLRAASSPLGRRAPLFLDDALPTTDPRSAAAAAHAGRTRFLGVRHVDGALVRQLHNSNCVAGPS